MQPAIRVENLAKCYRINHAVAGRDNYKTLRDSVAGAIQAPFKKWKSNGNGSPKTEDFWALKDVSFEVKPGEVVGIIGRNGAGKSTLLKILSRITKPTSGHVSLHGRVGSLLEVGTGFHPELTGRENVYLNGSILGMSRKEIDRQFDAIVDFSGVEKFLDTPVKRYSSGMYVRLAFAVAAHLNPEILIVDEVLAVGDGEFQEKCLGKMKDVANGGRTVIFVSHNMEAIARLTERCIMLERGHVSFDGPSDDAMNLYTVKVSGTGDLLPEYRSEVSYARSYVSRASVRTSENFAVHRFGKPIMFEFEICLGESTDSVCFSFQVLNSSGQPVCHFWLFDADNPLRRREGLVTIRCVVPRFRLFLGKYTLTTWLSERRADRGYENLHGICPFEVSMQGIQRPEYEWRQGDCAYLEEFSWETLQHSPPRAIYERRTPGASRTNFPE